MEVLLAAAEAYHQNVTTGSCETCTPFPNAGLPNEPKQALAVLEENRALTQDLDTFQRRFPAIARRPTTQVMAAKAVECMVGSCILRVEALAANSSCCRMTQQKKLR